MRVLSAAEMDAVSGGLRPSEGMGAVAGMLWGAAEMTALVPGAQGVSAFLGLGAGIIAGGAGVAAFFGD